MMSRTHIKSILLILTLTVSAALLHEVVVHDNTTCTVCVQFHSTPPAIDNGDTGIHVDFLAIKANQTMATEQAVIVRSNQTRSIRAPPQVLINS